MIVLTESDRSQLLFPHNYFVSSTLQTGFIMLWKYQKKTAL